MNNQGCIEEVCKKWVSDELASLHQELEKSTSDNDQAQRFARQLNHCQSVYNANIQSVQQAKRFRGNISKHKDRFLNTVLANYSPQSRQSYADYMNTLNFRLSPPEQDIEQQLVNDIRKENEAINSSSPSNNKVTTLIRNRERLTDGYSMCSSPMTISDSFIPTNNTVTVSYFSCHFHEHGKQMLAHELAHTLSYWFSKNQQHFDEPNRPSKTSYNQYMELRNCINKRYEINQFGGFSFYSYSVPGDKFRTEENMADLIAFQTFQDDPKLLFCGGLLPSSDGLQYKSPKILQPLGSPDKHSATLLRAIMEAIHKRKTLPESCQQVVNTYSNRGVNFKPCF